MPLFFFFSGYFFSLNRYSFKDFVLRKMKTLYLPFVIWSLIVLCFHDILVANDICKGPFYDIHKYKVLIYRIFVEMRQYEPLLGTFWFFPQLLAVNILGYLLFWLHSKVSCKLASDNIYKYTLLSVLLILAFVMSIHKVLFFHQIGSITILGLFFFVSGCFLSKCNLYGLAQILIASAVILFSGWSFREMVGLHSNDVFVYSVTALMGIVLVYNISSKLCVVKYMGDVLAYVGKHSLSIMVLHFASFKLVSALLIVLYDMPNVQLSSHPVVGNVAWYWQLCYMVVGIFVPLMLNGMYVKLKLVGKIFYHGR